MTKPYDRWPRIALSARTEPERMPWMRRDPKNPSSYSEKAVEVRAVEVIELDADALKLRKIEALRDLGAEIGVRLLIRVELRQNSPRFPGRALVVIVEGAERVTPSRIRTVDAGADLERVARNGERRRGVLIARERRMRETERNVDLAEVEKRMAGAEREMGRQLLDRFAFLLETETVHRVRSRHRDAEEICTNISPGICYVRIGGIRGEDDAGEEDVGLDAALVPIEVEVVDAAEREHGKLEAGVVMDSADHERPRGVEAFLDDALTGGILLDVPHALLRFADDAGVRC